MSAKTLDRQGRWRNKVVAFRVSPEEDEVLEAKVRMSGLTKQEYIVQRLHENDVVVHGNPRVFKALRNQMQSVLEELRRIAPGEDVSEDLLEVMNFMAAVMNGMQEENSED